MRRGHFAGRYFLRTRHEKSRGSVIPFHRTRRERERGWRGDALVLRDDDSCNDGCDDDADEDDDPEADPLVCEEGSKKGEMSVSMYALSLDKVREGGGKGDAPSFFGPFGRTRWPCRAVWI